ncbi:hypothetical protein [Frigoriglobus tundricola]|uniref:hypothetical protein n=1 Tax=Frigoriglobus tundricola TaxID=2774151 RepID=UPI00148ECF49|nr:hypothetical protein [Frigoriglobus tundricola]
MTRWSQAVRGSSPARAPARLRQVGHPQRARMGRPLQAQGRARPEQRFGLVENRQRPAVRVAFGARGDQARVEVGGQDAQVEQVRPPLAVEVGGRLAVEAGHDLLALDPERPAPGARPPARRRAPSASAAYKGRTWSQNACSSSAVWARSALRRASVSRRASGADSGTPRASASPPRSASRPSA